MEESAILHKGLHHFNPPQWADPECFALALCETLWTCIEVGTTAIG